eukprot:4442837-Amphidinium_carterae.1
MPKACPREPLALSFVRQADLLLQLLRRHWRHAARLLMMTFLPTLSLVDFSPKEPHVRIVLLTLAHMRPLSRACLAISRCLTFHELARFCPNVFLTVGITPLLLKVQPPLEEKPHLHSLRSATARPSNWESQTKTDAAIKFCPKVLNQDDLRF